MDIVNLVLFLAIFYLRITTTFEIQTNVLTNVENLTSPQLQNIAFLVDLEKNLIGINCILLWAKFLKYVSAHKTFSRITRTIGLAISEILIFFLIFGLSLFGFAMGGVSCLCLSSFCILLACCCPIVYGCVGHSPTIVFLVLWFVLPNRARRSWSSVSTTLNTGLWFIPSRFAPFHLPPQFLK
jgi:hypothetical protein